MTDHLQLPFSRSVEVHSLKVEDTLVAVEADERERAAVSVAIDVPSIERLKADFTLKPLKNGHVIVTGQMEADVHQICVVTLEPFSVHIEEPVEVEFAPYQEGFLPAAGTRSARDRQVLENAIEDEPASHELEEVDPPDPIVNGRIDLGVLASEFLVLGLDPFPRRPDAVFDFKDPADKEQNPFAALASLKKPD